MANAKTNVRRSKFCSDKNCWGSMQGAWTSDDKHCLGCLSLLVKKSPWETVVMNRAMGRRRQ